MATAPQSGLPIFYNGLTPLSSNDHADWKSNMSDTAPFVAKEHAVPITIEEFFSVQRFFPIVFSVGENPVPLALMGLNQGMNTMVDAEGKMVREAYVPAYIRRYPFMLARLRDDSDDLSLCFDPTSNALGPDGNGEPLFVDGQPSTATSNALKFCETFEQAAQQTGLFMKELVDAKMLTDGEANIQREGLEQPFIYRGFQMIDENKLRDMRGDQLRKWMQNGILPLIHAHLFSLQLMNELFERQMKMGLMSELAQPA